MHLSKFMTSELNMILLSQFLAVKALNAYVGIINHQRQSYSFKKKDMIKSK